MIVPITREEDWLTLLQSLPVWRPCAAPMVVIVPHPDDEILGLGGLLAAQGARGVDVSVVAVTDGEHAYPDDPATAALGRLRVVEQTAALARVGVSAGKITRLCLPDSDVRPHLPELIERISPMVTPQTQLLAPWRGDYHPDHEACGLAGEVISAATGAQLISYFFWTWHRATPELLQHLPLQSYSLSAGALLAKTEALQCHRSQIDRPSGEPILSPALLAPARRAFEVFLPS